MPIADPLYVLCLIVVSTIFYLLMAGFWRVAFVLAASYLYYLTFQWTFFPQLLLITSIAYLGGLTIQHFSETRAHRWTACGFLLMCFAPMIAYKYVFPFWNAAPENVALSGLIYPVGLSFYTFAAAGYLADVTLGVIDAESRPLRLAVFCAFFPTVTMGPVMRTDFLQQLTFAREFNPDRTIKAFSEILIGVVLKLWFADSLAVPANAIYGDLYQATPLALFIATAFVAFQVYADWLGYSMIAIGSARLLGVDLPENFRQPFISTSIPEFWRKWNISLINWLRDYVFTPLRLQFQSLPRLGIPLATLITFTLLGIWHAAGWGYVLYGVVNGVLVVASQATLAARNRIWEKLRCPSAVVKSIRVPITFLIVVMTVPLIRAGSLGNALFVYGSIFSWRFLQEIGILLVSPVNGYRSGILPSHCGISLLLIMAIIGGDLIAIYKPPRILKFRATMPAIYFVCSCAILYYAMNYREVSPFVYFRY